MSLPLRLDADATGETLAYDGSFLEVVSTRAFAPGAPVSLRIEFSSGPITVTGKSRGSKRRPDERFDIAFRLISLRREHREALLAHHAS